MDSDIRNREFLGQGLAFPLQVDPRDVLHDQEVDAGNQTLRVNQAGTSRTLVQQNVQLNAKSDYTVIVVNFLANLDMLFLTDDNTHPR